LKRIIHFNNQTDEINQNEGRSGINKDESFVNNPIEMVQEAKKLNRKNSEGNNSERYDSEENKSEGNNLKEKNLEVENSRENNLEEKSPNERNLETENLEDLSPDSLKDIEVEYEIVEKEILPEKIICPDCGGITLEGLDFCDKCGGELYIYNR